MPSRNQVIVLGGCQTVPVNVVPWRNLQRGSPEINKLIANAVDCPEQLQNKYAICPEPAKAIHNITFGFKYGRFCGQNYPDIPNKSGIEDKKLTPEERLDKAKKYYQIKPIDDIDKECQEHDVCWILYGEMDYCNGILKNHLDSLKQRFREGRSWIFTDNYQWRCAELAMDMSMASNFFESHSNDKHSELANKIANVVVSPIAVMYACVYYASFLEDNYPHPDERCLVDK